MVHEDLSRRWGVNGTGNLKKTLGAGEEEGLKKNENVSLVPRERKQLNYKYDNKERKYGSISGYKPFS